MLTERKDIDAIDVCTPNNTHAEIATAAAKAGKMILCEKPLSMTGDEGKKMVEAVEKAGVPNMVWYNYRRGPARPFPQQHIHEGKPGPLHHHPPQILPNLTLTP